CMIHCAQKPFSAPASGRKAAPGVPGRQNRPYGLPRRGRRPCQVRTRKAGEYTR
ncbi:MAG: hypothetical protein AVDCRST_MAG56-975, partial [uncultured Cytophagales bacterium]